MCTAFWLEDPLISRVTRVLEALVLTVGVGLLFLVLYEEVEHLRLDEEFDEAQVRAMIHGLQKALLLELAALDVLWEMAHGLDEDGHEGLGHQPVQLVCGCRNTQQQEVSGSRTGSGRDYRRAELTGVACARGQSRQKLHPQFSGQERFLVANLKTHSRYCF